MPKGITVVTIITPSYAKVGGEMVKRFKRYTGHDVKIIETTDALGFETKLHLDRHCKGATIFADCDLWPLREWRPEDIYLGNCIQGCHDHAVFNPNAFCHTDCHQNGLEWSTYLNSGLLCLPLDKPEFRELFKVARQSWRDRKKGKKTYVDTTDQASVNEAIKTLGLPIQFLPEQYNCYLFGIAHGQRPYIPREILNLHGAGIPAKKKYARLKVQASALGQAIYPMHQDAVNWEFARQFALR